jgi:hypothetical protein
MANQIRMSEQQSIAALHAQGVSNRQIAKLLSLHPGYGEPACAAVEAAKPARGAPRG